MSRSLHNRTRHISMQSISDAAGGGEEGMVREWMALSHENVRFFLRKRWHVVTHQLRLTEPDTLDGMTPCLLTRKGHVTMKNDEIENRSNSQ